jgi:hypothetical protein
MDAELQTLAGRRGYKLVQAITPGHWRLVDLNGNVLIKPDRAAAFTKAEAHAFLQTLSDSTEHPTPSGNEGLE